MYPRQRLLALLIVCLLLLTLPIPFVSPDRGMLPRALQRRFEFLALQLGEEGRTVGVLRGGLVIERLLLSRGHDGSSDIDLMRVG